MIDIVCNGWTAAAVGITLAVLMIRALPPQPGRPAAAPARTPRPGHPAPHR